MVVGGTPAQSRLLEHVVGTRHAWPTHFLSGVHCASTTHSTQELVTGSHTGLAAGQSALV
jgi:hypothetical protein